MAIRKINRSTLVGQVTAQIENMIESGLWKVGEKIPAEPELMNKFDVSRNTLREAIQSLVHVGMLETRQGIGTIVKSNSNLGMALEKKIQKSDLLETLEVRLALEREAAQLAAERREVEDLEQIETCLKKCKIAAENNDSLQFIKMDIDFHKAIVQATHNKIFIELYEHITDSLQSSVDKVMEIKNTTSFENEIHHSLLQAIKTGDTKLAVESVNEYLNKAKEALYTMIN
ncbi:FadR family transcriptional regulator [Clostridium botulinum]|uniref:FadR/GntR family transcriptional regulator n=1 Tax=Clostridium botulinum TaxID=1491 RepID=UPI0013759625|nr:FadR/GntR family transcriptional regulator [Clostridium botulinum]MCC5416294.1 FadR family transcriptional regulator [Clostridium botulinum]NCI18819.1 FadR family transcriptional regulator [Clostridium botulinum]NCI34518.1 FadR family transcriptional regulator [Clostridium botulinum]NCI74121.1 FadR family transcriptional regulator [Clostridium botulinum]NDI37447.1 FadR family transcriptional regulator [Clostridium botulinum]